MNVLLIHGLGRTTASLSGLGKSLQQAGHSVYFFGYFAWLRSFDEIALQLRDRLQALTTQGPYGVVTHSMGGILLRVALAKADFPLPVHVVMLAPPNQSPQAARLANQLLPFRWFSGQSGANLASAEFYSQLAPLSCPYTLIAGTVGPTGPFSPFGDEPNDLILSLSDVKMRSQDTPILVPAPHSFIMNHPQTKAAIIQAFSNAAT
jgi:hypothetical protein